MTEQTGNNKPNEAEGLGFTLSDNKKLIDDAEQGNRAIEERDHRSLFEAAAREQLIVKAATAILASEGIEPQDDGTYWGENTWPNAVKDAATALAVFEKALTPTDDERAQAGLDSERLRQIAEWLGMEHGHDETAKRVALIADRHDRLAAGFRRSEVPEPSAEQPKHLCAAHPFGCPEPQGEPSNAQVNRDYLAQVIHKAVYSRIPLDDLTDEAQADTYKRAAAVVAALRAAGGVR